MSSVRTRRQAAAVSTPTTPSPAPRDQVTMNGNGSARGLVKEDGPKENIFLFWPNVIGQLSPQRPQIAQTNILQDMPELFSRSHPYITCLCILRLAPDSTVFPASSMLLTDMPRAISNNQHDLVRFWTW
jgi:hypothetical protein